MLRGGFNSQNLYLLSYGSCFVHVGVPVNLSFLSFIECSIYWELLLVVHTVSRLEPAAPVIRFLSSSLQAALRFWNTGFNLTVLLTRILPSWTNRTKVSSWNLSAFSLHSFNHAVFENAWSLPRFWAEVESGGALCKTFPLRPVAQPVMNANQFLYKHSLRTHWTFSDEWQLYSERWNRRIKRKKWYLSGFASVPYHPKIMFSIEVKPVV